MKNFKDHVSPKERLHKYRIGHVKLNWVSKIMVWWMK